MNHEEKEKDIKFKLVKRPELKCPWWLDIFYGNKKYEIELESFEDDMGEGFTYDDISLNSIKVILEATRKYTEKALCEGRISKEVERCVTERINIINELRERIHNKNKII